MKIELAFCESMLLNEIADKRMKRRDVAQTYALALKSSEVMGINWRKVNTAIIERWSPSWSGKCFAKAKGDQP